MPDIVGTSVGGSNVALRVFVIVMLGICALGALVYTNGARQLLAGLSG